MLEKNSEKGIGGIGFMDRPRFNTRPVSFYPVSAVNNDGIITHRITVLLPGANHSGSIG